ncbi:conserved hypothetical protein [Leptospira interrogans serovar Manilae]|uniref:Uncharacterized protein n=1 Tax=Leptospira interrogans serovar Manilae TaxID=214675 RepID=A0AAQ1NUT7_LEPIR|nr:conserved hypothetical protein [Leptospira interrogans serovar Manilae]
MRGSFAERSFKLRISFLWALEITQGLALNTDPLSFPGRLNSVKHFF